MKGPLRTHIIRKRRRLKQEQEQDAIEKRLKKEKELKRIQDAMTLDQIKDRLAALEIKLQTLKDEKHDLFVQLKQVLSEDNSKRKQNEAEAQKRQKLSNEKVPVSSETTSTTTTTTTSSCTMAAPIAIPSSQTKMTIKTSVMPIKHCQIPKPTQSSYVSHTNPPRRQFSSQTSLSNINKRLPPPPQPPYSQTSLTNQMIGLTHLTGPSTPMGFSNPNDLRRSQIEAQNLTSLQTHFRSPIDGPMSELFSSNLLDSEQPRLNQAGLRLPTSAMLMDLPLTLSSNIPRDPKLMPPNAIGKRPSHSIGNSNTSLSLGDRSPGRKTNSFAGYQFHPNQFFVDTLPHGLPTNLPQFNRINQDILNSSSAMPLHSSSPSMVPSHHHSRKHFTHPAHFDHLASNQGKPNGMPGLWLTQPLMPSQQQQQQQFDPQRHGWPPRYKSEPYYPHLQLNPQEEARLFAASATAANYHRKNESKNPYRSNK